MSPLSYDYHNLEKLSLIRQPSRLAAAKLIMTYRDSGFFGSRVGFIVDVGEMLKVQVGVDLGCTDITMP
jgi:hypothetical protein